MTRPVVLVVHDPDYDREYTVDGDVEIIDIDLGRSFNGPKQFNAESEVGREWLRGACAQVAHLPPESKVRAELEALCDTLQGEGK